MTVKIASLYAEISGDTTKLEAGLKRTKTGLSETATQSKSVGANIGAAFTNASLVVGGLAAAAYAAKAAVGAVMDLGREGAEINYAADRFDRLAASIGTTSDALLGDLKKATKSTISDAALMKSAGDLMGLGLADTREEAVRLSKVVGGLGMDMNQLVLTLTNQTTMRFDALGVSVAGFDEKVEALRKTGLSASDAFQEAFLQQAEAQLAKVGDRAETDAGKIARLEAAWANLGDEFKASVAPGIAAAAESLAAFLNQQSLVADRMAEFEGAGRGENPMARKYRELAIAQYEASDAGKAYAERLKEQADAFARLTGKTEVAEEAQFEYKYTIEEVTDTELEHYRAMQKSSEELENSQGKARQLADAYKGVQSAQQELSDAQADFAKGAGADAATALENTGVGAERYRQGLGAIDEVFGTSLGQQADYNKALEAAGDEFRRTGDLDAYKNKLTEIKDQYAPLEESIISATTKLEYFREVWDSITSKTVQLRLDAGVSSNTGSSGSYTGGNRGSSGTTTTNRRHGGEVDAASGLNMVVPAGYPNDSYELPLNVSSGEVVQVTPANQSTAAGGTKIFYIFSKDKPGTITNGIKISQLMGGAA